MEEGEGEEGRRKGGKGAHWNQRHVQRGSRISLAVEHDTRTGPTRHVQVDLTDLVEGEGEMTGWIHKLCGWPATGKFCQEGTVPKYLGYGTFSLLARGTHLPRYLPRYLCTVLYLPWEPLRGQSRGGGGAFWLVSFPFHTPRLSPLPTLGTCSRIPILLTNYLLYIPTLPLSRNDVQCRQGERQVHP